MRWRRTVPSSVVWVRSPVKTTKSGLVVAAFYVPRHWRVPAIASAGVVGLLIMVASWGQLLGIKREGTVEDSEHSVSQRQSFAYVSWQMFCDHPVFGVGFGRFYDRKLPYLSDRSQNFELESLRPLHHHNTLLSVLTETGLTPHDAPTRCHGRAAAGR